LGKSSQLNTVVNIESKSAPTIAYQKLEIENPGDSAATISKDAAFTMKRNNPSVRIVMGRANKLRMGFMIALTIPKMSAVIIIEVTFEK
jgi:hypothetical protein